MLKKKGISILFLYFFFCLFVYFLFLFIYHLVFVLQESGLPYLLDSFFSLPAFRNRISWSRCSKPRHSVLGRYGWVFHIPVFWWTQDRHIAAPAACPLLFGGHSAATHTPRWWGNTDKSSHTRQPIRFCGTSPFDAGSSHTTVWLSLTRSKNLVTQTENWVGV